MPWGAGPYGPISGTVITVAWAQTSVVDPLNWLRTLTGGGDPPGSSYVVVSTSTTATGWMRIPTDAIAAGAVTDAKMALLKINAVNPLVVLFSDATSGSGFFDASGATTDSPLGSGDWHVIQSQNRTGSAYRFQIGVALSDVTQTYVRAIVAGTPTAWYKLWHAGNDGVGSGLDAALLDGQGSAFYATASAVAALNTVPSGMIAAFETLAELTAAGAGWARYTAADGRLLVGAGTTFSQTFAQATNYGANWTPSSGLSVGAVAAHAGSDFFLVNVGTFGNVATVAHGHPAPTLVGAATAWLPPMRAVIQARKT